MGTFSDSVNPSSFKILTQPDYIFLCGGRLGDFAQSLRAHFYKDKVLTNPDLRKRVQLAENADKWYLSRRVFADLLELEEYLAGLSACILLFVESPGAIAEFGAFSQMELLQDKLVVVIENSDYEQTSFIRNGLVERANRIRPKSVLSYPWFSTQPEGGIRGIDPAGAAATSDEIEKEIQKILKKKPKTTAFRNDDHGHRMLLIADLVTLNVIVLQRELKAILDSLEMSIKPSELKKYLFLLDQLDLISTFRHGNVVYHLNPSGIPEYVDYAPKTPMDRSRLRTLLRADLRMTRKKNNALSAFKRRSVGIAP
ncbi:MAG: retron St85 family effector protein [Acidobacteriaceae bacterium]